MNVKATTCKGTRDFNSSSVYKREYIINIIKSCFRNYGFSPIETPSFENSNTLLGKYGDEGDRLIFKILKSGNFLKDVNNYGFSRLIYTDINRDGTKQGPNFDETLNFFRKGNNGTTDPSDQKKNKRS